MPKYRLSRNGTFLLKLIDSSVEVLFADLPELKNAMGRSCANPPRFFAVVSHRLGQFDRVIS